MHQTQYRQKTILDLLAGRQVRSQEELQALLEERGISATQATLSRDLKTLRIGKVQGEGYVLPRSATRKPAPADLSAGIISLQFSGNLAIAKTAPGFANAVATVVDGFHTEGILGTIAGDDTVLIVLSEGTSAASTLEGLGKLFPSIK